MRDGGGIGDHVRGVTAVARYPGASVNIFASKGAVASATAAIAAGSAEPAHSGPLADPPARHAGPQGVDDADHFMPGNAGIANVGKQAFDGDGVAVADAARLHADRASSGPGPGCRVLPAEAAARP